MADAPKSKTPDVPKKAAKPATKAATPKAKPAKPATVPVKGAAKTTPAAKPGAAPTGNPYEVVFHPIVTEKTMFNMDKNNSLEFLVAPHATKPEIAKAVEQLFTVKVYKVTTRHTREGKRAVVRFAEGYSAEDVGMRVGVF